MVTRRGITPWVMACVAAAAVALVVTVIPGAEERGRRDTARRPNEADRTDVPRAEEPASTAEAATLPALKRVAATPARDALSPTPSTSSPPPVVSPLQRSPGYYPPADPESASVRLGRRDAREVPDLFEGGATSMEEFGRLVVAALSAQDVHALHSLRITRGEFEKILWPEFPESRPITNIQAADAWSLSEPRSLSGANRAMGLYGGRQLRFLTIEAARVQTFTNFLLHRDVTILAVDEGTAEVQRIVLAPSVAERKGRFKALLYRD